MLRGLDTIEILSEYESPIQSVAMEEEVSSMLVGSLSIPKRKRQTQRSIPTPLEKRKTHTYAKVCGEGTA